MGNILLNHSTIECSINTHSNQRFLNLLEVSVDINISVFFNFACVLIGNIDDVLDGFNSTIFAYGQTGSGKTFTMFGPHWDDNQGH